MSKDVADLDSSSKTESAAAATKASAKQDKKLFATSVNMRNINIKVIKRWLSDRIQRELPDDDVAVEFIFELLVGADDDQPSIAEIREHMDDYLGEVNSLQFCRELWSLLVSGQSSKDGIPEQLVEQRKRELAEEAKDRAARQTTDQILNQLRPQTLRGRRNDTKPARVSKPARAPKLRKTNYNRI